jgi:hypothetical protein
MKIILWTFIFNLGLVFAQGPCEQRIQEKINLLERDLKFLTLGQSVGLGAMYGTAIGLGHYVGDQIDMNNYENGTIPGQSKPSEPQLVSDVVVGAATGAAVGAGVHLGRKALIKRKIKMLKSISYAFSMIYVRYWDILSDDVLIKRAANILLPLGSKDELQNLRNVLEDYQKSRCEFTGKDFSIRKLKKFIRSSL